MVMVRTSESSQCCAVAVPCAWKALRMGCVGDSRGGSVVLQRWVQHMQSLGRLRAPLTRVKGIEGTKSFGAVDPPSGHARNWKVRCRGLSCTFATFSTYSTRIVVEGSGERGMRPHSSEGRRGGLRAGAAKRSDVRLATTDRRRWWAMVAAWMQERERIRSKDSVAEVHCWSHRGVQETSNSLCAKQHGRYPGATGPMHLGQCIAHLWRGQVRDAPRAANSDDIAPVALSRPSSCHIPGVVLPACASLGTRGAAKQHINGEAERLQYWRYGGVHDNILRYVLKKPKYGSEGSAIDMQGR